ISGILASFTTNSFYTILLKGQSSNQIADPTEGRKSNYFTVDKPAPMVVMTALRLASRTSLRTPGINCNTLYTKLNDFRDIIQLLIETLIIPLLPFHIFGIFANMTYAGQVSTILGVFAKVFVMIIILHILYLMLQYTMAGILSKQNPLHMLRTMLPAYFTALGTQSSAAAIPVTLNRTKKLRVKDHVADFTVPLLANIHLSGSTITIVSCALAVMFLQGSATSFSMVLPFILMLAVTMVAAPGVP